MKIISFIPPFLSSFKLKKRSAKERRSVSRSDNSSFASTTSTSSEDLSPTPRSILSRTITGRELEVVLRHLDPDGPTEAEVLAALSDVGVSVSRSGRIALAELTALGGAGGSDEMRETFAVFDVNGDGKISAEELMALFATLGEGCSIEECRRMIGEVDSDGDGFVCFEDFVRMMNGQR